MKVLVFGAGSLGSVLGALLSRAHEVTLVTRGKHLREIRENGLKLEGLIEGVFNLEALELPDHQSRYDLVIITTKSYDTESAGRACEKIVADEGAILSVQNGLGNIEILGSIFRERQVVAGVTSMAAFRPQPGIVRYVAEGEIILGSMHSDSNALAIAGRALSQANIPISKTDNIQGTLWSKAIVNAVINPITALLGCRNGTIVENELLRNTAKSICREAMDVAIANGVKLNPSDVWSYTIDVADRTRENRSSMLMDVRGGRRTEIDAICGSILKAASETGSDTPLISGVYSMMKFLENSGRHQKG